MTVSKDGTLAFIQFSLEEIGTCLTEDETVSSHLSLLSSGSVSQVTYSLSDLAKVIRVTVNFEALNV